MQSTAPLFLPQPSTVLDAVRTPISEQAIGLMPCRLDSFEGFEAFEGDYFVSQLLKPTGQVSHASVQIVVASETAWLFSVYRLHGATAFSSTNTGINGCGSLTRAIIKGLEAVAQEAAKAATKPPEANYWTMYKTDRSVCSGKYGDPLATEM